MWIERHGHRLLDVIHGVQFGDDVIFKTSALLTVIVGNKGMTELVKASVSTNTFSNMSLDWSIFKISIHNRSWQLMAANNSCCVCGPV